jgi:hypothetical protein
VWSIECEEIFQQLKHLLANALVLGIVDLDKDYIVCIVACKEGLDGVIMQDNHVVSYESRKLKEHEVDYVTHDLQLVSIIHTLNMWRHYLLGRFFFL